MEAMFFTYSTCFLKAHRVCAKRIPKVLMNPFDFYKNVFSLKKCFQRRWVLVCVKQSSESGEKVEFSPKRSFFPYY